MARWCCWRWPWAAAARTRAVSVSGWQAAGAGVALARGQFQLRGQAGRDLVGDRGRRRGAAGQDPASSNDDASLDVEKFDASIRDGLADFFRRALHRDSKKRFDNADLMHLAWKNLFRHIDQTTQDDDGDGTQEACDNCVGVAHASQLDTDGDGHISRAEARAHPTLDAEFAAIDVNRDGRLSREELAGWLR